MRPGQLSGRDKGLKKLEEEPLKREKFPLRVILEIPVSGAVRFGGKFLGLGGRVISSHWCYS